MMMRALGAVATWVGVGTVPLANPVWADAGAAGPLEEETVGAVAVEVDLSERRLYVLSDGGVVRTFEVGIGTSRHPTPTGSFTIDRIIWNPDWIPPNVAWARDETPKSAGDPENPMQGAKIFFKFPDYYIHGTNAPHTVGSAASHGCLRMRQSEVEELAELLQKAGGADRGGAWFRRVKDSKTEKAEVRLPNAIRVTIRK